MGQILRRSHVRPENGLGLYPIAALEMIEEQDEFIIRCSLYFNEKGQPWIQEFVLLRPLNLTASWRWIINMFQEAVNSEPIYERLLGDLPSMEKVIPMQNRHISGSAAR